MKKPFVPLSTYKEASYIVENVLKKRGSVRSLCFADSVQNKKAIFALVTETLKYKSVLDELVTSCNLTKKFPKFLLYVTVYDMILGRGLGMRKGQLVDFLNEQKPALSAALVRMKIKAKAKTNEELLPQAMRSTPPLPRYVRVNALLSTQEDATKHFESEGFELVTDPIAVMTSTTSPGSPVAKIFAIDKDVPNLLVFPPRTDFHDHSLLKQGKIILQDKASCLPAHVLSPPRDSHVIDACAAPGNKTSHLSAILGNTGRVFAFDVDARRLGTLVRLTGRAGAKNIEATNKSFLEVDPLDPKYARVENILLDPSCSGSGIVNRFEAELAEEISEESEEQQKTRLESLAQFQLSAILHAFTFPHLKRLVYSTCSIHAEENERVVKKALQSNSEFRLVRALPTWGHRGFKEECKQGDFTIRASPEIDHTNGFFVSLFERKSIPQSKIATVTPPTAAVVEAAEETATKSADGSGKSQKSKKGEKLSEPTQTTVVATEEKEKEDEKVETTEVIGEKRKRQDDHQDPEIVVSKKQQKVEQKQVNKTQLPSSSSRKKKSAKRMLKKPLISK